MKQSDRDFISSMTMKVVEIAARVPHFSRKADEWQRAGFPRSSVPDAISGSSEPILPGFDSVDVKLAEAERTILGFFRSIEADAHRLDRLLNSWLLVAPPVDDPYPCVNLDCKNDLEAGLKSGECVRCRVHRHRHGMPYRESPTRRPDA